MNRVKKGLQHTHSCYHFSDGPVPPKCWLLFSDDIKELKPILFIDGKKIWKNSSIGATPRDNTRVSIVMC